jgi:hypothetical protein
LNCFENNQRINPAYLRTPMSRWHNPEYVRCWLATKGSVPVKELAKKAVASLFGLNKGKMGGTYKWVD